MSPSLIDCKIDEYLDKNGDNLDTGTVERGFQAIATAIQAYGVPEDHILWQRYHFLDETIQYLKTFPRFAR